MRAPQPRRKTTNKPQIYPEGLAACAVLSRIEEFFVQVDSYIQTAAPRSRGGVSKWSYFVHADGYPNHQPH